MENLHIHGPPSGMPIDPGTKGPVPKEQKSTETGNINIEQSVSDVKENKPSHSMPSLEPHQVSNQPSKNFAGKAIQDVKNQTTEHGTPELRSVGKMNVPNESRTHLISKEQPTVENQEELRGAPKMMVPDESRIPLTSKEQPTVENHEESSVNDDHLAHDGEEGSSVSANSEEDDFDFGEIDEEQEDTGVSANEDAEIHDDFDELRLYLEKSGKETYEFNISNEDLQDIKEFFDSSDIKSEIENLQAPKYYPASNKLPYPAIFVPGDGFNKGINLISDKPLGKGSASVVTLALNLDGDKQSLKAFKSIDYTAMTTFNEVGITKVVADSNSTRLIGGTPLSYQANSTEKVGFLMDLVAGDDLYYSIKNDLLDDMPPGDNFNAKNRLMIDCAKALVEAHDLNIVHGDLKPENFLIADTTGEVKLFDWGSSANTGTERELGTCTLAYRPPEGTRGKAHTALDIWSFGTVLADVFRGSDFASARVKDENLFDSEKNLHAEKFMIFSEFKNNSHVDAIIYQCLNLNPEKRPSAREVLKALENYDMDCKIFDSDQL